MHAPKTWQDGKRKPGCILIILETLHFINSINWNRYPPGYLSQSFTNPPCLFPSRQEDLKIVSLKVVIEGGGVRRQEKNHELKKLLLRGGGQGIGFNLLIYSDHRRLPPPLLADLRPLLQRSAPMEINSISTLISKVRTPPGSTHGDIYGVSWCLGFGVSHTMTPV